MILSTLVVLILKTWHIRIDFDRWWIMFIQRLSWRTEIHRKSLAFLLFYFIFIQLKFKCQFPWTLFAGAVDINLATIAMIRTEAKIYNSYVSLTCHSLYVLHWAHFCATQGTFLCRTQQCSAPNVKIVQDPGSNVSLCCTKCYDFGKNWFSKNFKKLKMGTVFSLFYWLFIYLRIYCDENIIWKGLEA